MAAVHKSMLSLMGYARHAVVLCICMRCIMLLASNATEGLLSRSFQAPQYAACILLYISAVPLLPVHCTSGRQQNTCGGAMICCRQLR